MEEFDCGSWEEFERQILVISKQHEDIRGKRSIYSSPALFRGQECANWLLTTTLERMSITNFEVKKYHKIIRTVQPQVTSLTMKDWDIPNYSPTEGQLTQPPPGYEFMVYLRHHGFPSPLLDWTRSPYVAAFFAFRSKQPSPSENVAIYSYIEYCGVGKLISSNKASLLGLGSTIKTHKRHFIQQCEYTICRKLVDDRYVYCPHEEAFQQNNEKQDRLIKFIIPRSEREKVLEKLNFMN
ncbi:MAG: FRG domain-containing protein, partial [Nitrospirales bacterium]